MKANLVKKFDDLVRDKTDPEVYESYHDKALQHKNGHLTVKQFREHLEILFKKYD
jgi:hypothetical protein